MTGFTLPCAKCGASSPQQVCHDRTLASAPLATCPARGLTLGVRLCPDQLNRYDPLVNEVADAIQSAEGDEVAMAQAAIRAVAARTRASEEDTQRSEAEPPHLQRLIEAAEAFAIGCRNGAQGLPRCGSCPECTLRQALQPYRSGKQ